MAESKRSPFVTIFITVFMDMLGVTIVIPVIPALFFAPESASPEALEALVLTGLSETTTSMLYGLLLACYPIMQFFGAPVLGALSDRHGRKPILSIALVGTMIGYLLFGVAILTKNIWLLFFARMLPGFTGGNISIAFSAIADISSAEAKARNFGLVGAAFGLGFILGPTVGGLLADNTVVSWFTHATPFWFTAALTLVNILLVRFRFPETIKQKSATKVTFTRGFQNIATSFKEANLRKTFSVVLLLSLGFAFFTQFFGAYLIQVFDYGEKEIGYLFGWVGIWLVITQAIIVRWLSKRYGPKTILTYSTFALALFLGMVALPDQAMWFYLLNPFIAMAQGITSPNLTAFVSQQARPDQQGQILGINQSMVSVGQSIPPLISGYTNALSPAIPMISAAIFTLAGWMIFNFLFKMKKKKAVKEAV
jgi:DHA1 family tetracycline resistance protein-like MFS transporter